MGLAVCVLKVVGLAPSCDVAFGEMNRKMFSVDRTSVTSFHIELDAVDPHGEPGVQF